METEDSSLGSVFMWFRTSPSPGRSRSPGLQSLWHLLTCRPALPQRMWTHLGLSTDASPAMHTGWCRQMRLRVYAKEVNRRGYPSLGFNVRGVLVPKGLPC